MFLIIPGRAGGGFHSRRQRGGGGWGCREETPHLADVCNVDLKGSGVSVTCWYGINERKKSNQVKGLIGE